MYSQVEPMSTLGDDFHDGCGKSRIANKTAKTAVNIKNGSGLLYVITTFVLLLSIIPTQVGAIECQYTTAPEQVHLALRPTGMTVSWATPGYSRDTDTPKAKVFYGTDRTNLDKSSDSGYSSSYYPEVPYRYFFHNVYLDGLTSGTTYFYRIGASTRCSNDSTIRSFISTPSQNPNQSMKMTLIGDVSVSPFFNLSNTLATFTALKTYAADSTLMLFIGDLGYADSFITYTPDLHIYEDVLNDFARRMDPIASYMPVQVVPGNHEVSCLILNGSLCPTYLRHFNAYLNRYCMSGELSGGYKNLWYSFDYGSAHVIMLNMETDFPSAPSGPGSSIDDVNAIDDSTQVRWFLADIAKATAPAQRAKIPWLIVGGHRAFGGSEFEPLGPPRPGKRAPLSTLYCVSCRNTFMRYFEQYYVDFYVSGHVHWVELLYPLDGSGEVATTDFTAGKGTIHITQGSGGPPLQNNHLSKLDTERSAFQYEGYGWSDIIIRNSTHATVTFFEARNTTTLKTFNIVRKR